MAAVLLEVGGAGRWAKGGGREGREAQELPDARAVGLQCAQRLRLVS